MLDNDDDEGAPLTARSFVKWLDGEIVSLTEAVIATGKKEDEYNILRGRVIALRKTKEVFLNKKK